MIWQIEIDDEQVRELEALAKRGGLATHKDLLNNALTLLKWAAAQRTRGWTIVAMNEQDDTYKALDMPFLDRVAES